MEEQLSIANLYIQNLLQVPSASFLLDTFQPQDFFIEHSFFSGQLPVNSKIYSQIVSQECRRSIFHIVDRFQIHWCFVITDDWLTAIGPYRTEEFSRQKLHIMANRLQLNMEHMQDFHVYYASIPMHTRTDIDVAAYSIFMHLYNDTQHISSFFISSENEKLPQDLAYYASSGAFAEKTHDLESIYMNAVAAGNTTEAIFVLRQIIARTSIRFNGGNTLLVAKVGAAISRTEGRLALKGIGVPSPTLDAISGEFSQRTIQGLSNEELIQIQIELTKRYCEIARQYRLSPYSVSIRKAIHYVYKNLANPITVGSIAEEAGLSPNRLSTNFHKETGITLSSYICNARLERAAQHLLNTTWDIQQISSAVGIPDSSYFSRIFKKKYGTTPSEYRYGLLSGSVRK